MRVQEFQLRFGLDALRGHLKPQRLADADDDAHDRVNLRRGTKVLNERFVDLDPVDRQHAQIGQIRVAGAEIVQRDGDAELLQGTQHVQRSVSSSSSR
jgi:hypothetical protein